MTIEKYKLGKVDELSHEIIFEGTFSSSGELILSKSINDFPSIIVEWSQDGTIEKRTRFIMRDISTGKYLVGEKCYMIPHGFGGSTSYIRFGFSEDGMKLNTDYNSGVLTRIIGIS